MPNNSDWKFSSKPPAEPDESEVVMQSLYLSLDAAMRDWMNEGRSYIRPIAIDGVMRAGGARTSAS